MIPELGIRWDDLPGLRTRAASLLVSGPLATPDLASDLLHLRYTPGPVATALVREVLAPDPRFELRDGRWGLRDEAARASRTPLAALDFVVVDLETTGGSPATGDRVTELAAIRVRDGRMVERFESLVNPECPIPGAVTALTNITQDMVADAPRFTDLIGPLRPLLEGCIFVAHNAEFDWRFLRAEFARCRGIRLQGPRVCTVQLARRLHPDLQRRNLRALSEFYGIDGEAWHRAGPDAETAAALFVRFLDRLGEEGVHDWGSLRSFLTGGPARNGEDAVENGADRPASAGEPARPGSEEPSHGYDTEANERADHP